MAENWYPIFLNLTGRLCLVVGGGEVALRKVESLREAGAKVRVVAPQVCGDILRMKGVEVQLQPYDAAALAGVALAVVATDSPATNAQVAADCRSRGVFCNAVDDPAQCDFILPSVMRQGPLVIAVSTGGASPTVAARIRRELEEQFGPAWGEWLAALGDARRVVQTHIADETQRRRVFQRLSEDDVLDAAKQGAAALRSKVDEVLKHFGLGGGRDHG